MDRPSNAFQAISTGVQDAVPAGWRRAAQRNPGWFWAGGLLLLAALVWYFFPSSSKQEPPKTVSVTVAKVAIADVPVSITALGAAQAWTSVTILAQVSGKLLSVNFAEGTDVRAGQVLAQIDPAPYRAVLLQAEGALKRDQALLANARIDLARYQALVAAKAVSQQVYATQAALVKQDEGTVLIDQGQVAAAKVNLGWYADHLADHRTRRRAPGRSGQSCQRQRFDRQARRQRQRPPAMRPPQAATAAPASSSSTRSSPSR